MHINQRRVHPQGLQDKTTKHQQQISQTVSKVTPPLMRGHCATAIATSVRQANHLLVDSPQPPILDGLNVLAAAAVAAHHTI